MKTRKTEIMIIEGVGDEVLDVVLATVNYSMEGTGEILIHTEDLGNSNDTNGHTEKISEALEGYEGLVLLRK